MGTRHCPRKDFKDCVTGCRNDRIDSEVIIHCNSLVIRQDLCVDAIVRGDEPPTTGQPTILQDGTIIYAYPIDPVRPLLLMSVIARNLSQNDVTVSIDNGEEALVEATVAANSEVALSAPDARLLIASAPAPSRVQFFITVFHPGDPILPVDPV